MCHEGAFSVLLLHCFYNSGAQLSHTSSLLPKPSPVNKVVLNVIAISSGIGRLLLGRVLLIGVCTTCNFMYLARGPWQNKQQRPWRVRVTSWGELYVSLSNLMSWCPNGHQNTSNRNVDTSMALAVPYDTNGILCHSHQTNLLGRDRQTFGFFVIGGFVFSVCQCPNICMFMPIWVSLHGKVFRITGLLWGESTFDCCTQRVGNVALSSFFATDCPGGVWCRGLTTCPLSVGPLFGNLVWNDSRFVSLT